MGIIIRQGFKSTILSYIGVVLGAFNLLWFFPKYLSADEIGIITLLQSLAFVLASFVQLGGNNIVDKFFPRFRDEEAQHHGFFALVLLYCLVGFSVFVAAYFGFKSFWLTIYAEKSPQINQFFPVLPWLTFFLMYQAMLEAFCRTRLRIVVPTLLREVFFRLSLILGVGVYFFGYISFVDLGWWLLVTYALAVLILGSYLQRLGALKLSLRFDLRSPIIRRQIPLFGLVITLGGAGALIVSRVDGLMLGALSGSDTVGIYSIAFYMGTVIEMPRRAVGQISTPIISQAWTDGDLAKIDYLYKNTALHQLLIGALFFLLVWCNVDALFNLIPHAEVYRAGKYVILYIGLGRLIDMATGINNEIILQSPYYRFNLVVIILLAVLVVVTNLIFIPLYGINGAALATALSVLLFNTAKFLFLWVKFHLQPFGLKTLYALLCMLITYLFTWMIPPAGPEVGPSLLNIVVRSGLIVLVFGGSVLLFRIFGPVGKLLRTVQHTLMRIF